MAQLPPKIPNMPPNWSNFGHQRTASMGTFLPTTAAAAAAAQPSWVDEFLDFTSAKRGSHRRSVSDTIAFLEGPLVVDDCSRVGQDFDRLDDDQLMSMFSDDLQPPSVHVSSSNPSTPSDHTSVNEEKPAVSWEPEDVQSECKVDDQAPAVAQPNLGSEPIADPKRVKRILANRQSAQRSRVRKLQYISELERSVTSLQTEVSALSPRVAFLDHQRSILTVGNSALRQQIAALAQDKIFKDAHQDALRKEIERLRQVYHQQNLKKTTAATPCNNNSDHPAVSVDKELIS